MHNEFGLGKPGTFLIPDILMFLYITVPTRVSPQTLNQCFWFLLLLSRIHHELLNLKSESS